MLKKLTLLFIISSVLILSGCSLDLIGNRNNITKTHTLTVTKEGEGEVITDNNNQIVNLIPSAKKGWIFEDWQGENGNEIEYDNEIDALYIRLQEINVDHTYELQEGLNLDLDEIGKLIGLEILDAADKYSLADIFNIATENLILDQKRDKKVA